MITPIPWLPGFPTVPRDRIEARTKACRGSPEIVDVLGCGFMDPGERVVPLGRNGEWFIDARESCWEWRPMNAKDEDPGTRQEIAEIGLLSSVLTDPGCFARVSERVRATDFDDPRHQAIWRICQIMAARGTLGSGEAASLRLMEAVAAKLCIPGPLGADVRWVEDLAIACPSSAHAEHFADEIVALRGLLR